MNEELKSFIHQSEEYLCSESKQQVLKKCSDIVMSQIEAVLKETTDIKNYILNGRIKKSSSLKEKILRKVEFYEKSNRNAHTFIDKVLDDIIGVRIICLLSDDEDKIYEILQQYFSKEVQISGTRYFMEDKEEDSFPYLAYLYEDQPVPQKNGEGIYKLKLKWFLSHDEFINIELQIKSLTHMVWGELEHMLFYKNYKYDLDHELHSKIMLSINKILKILDSQLNDLQYHLMQSNKIKDTQSIITKFLYNTIHHQVKEIYDIELDLREIYTLISQLYFYQCKEYKHALECSKQLFKAIAELEINEEYFNLNTINIPTQLQDDFKDYIQKNNDKEFFDNETAVILNNLAQKIGELSKSNDIFWGCLISIYTQLLSQKEKKETIEESYKDAILNITYHFIKNFTEKYIREVEIVDYPENLFIINNIILNVLNKCFFRYKKLDFFLESVHQNNIKDIIKHFFEAHEKTLEEMDVSLKGLNEDQSNKLTEMIFNTIELQVKYQLDGKLDIDQLNTLKDSCTENNSLLPWAPRIHNQNLEDISQGKIVIRKIEELYKHLYVEENQ